MKNSLFPDNCIICGSPNYIGKFDYACSNNSCAMRIGRKEYVRRAMNFKDYDIRTINPEVQTKRDQDNLGGSK